MATWFITGTSSGFGRHLTELLLERGDRVAATCREIEAMDDLEGRYGHRLWKAALDVTDTSSPSRVRRGELSMFRNNAALRACRAGREAENQRCCRPCPGRDTDTSIAP
jgi:NADP-dependent 3-hydroxy acid dehydrogenase YdfG